MSSLVRAIGRRTINSVNHMLDLFSIGQAYLKLGQDEKAVGSWKRSAKIFALIDQAHELHETMNHLREAAQKAGVDISVTEAFVERWHEGELYESPCRE
jgi:hypothetical protein